MYVGASAPFSAMNNKPTFLFRTGARVKGNVNAQTIGEELERIRDTRDELTPQIIVDESTPSDAPLHPCFTWDNAIAANEFRKVEARTIVRSVRAMYPDSGETEPAFIHVTKINGTTESTYERARVVVQEFSLLENAWRTAQSRLTAAAESLDDLEKLIAKQKDSELIKQAKIKLNQATALLTRS